MRTPSPTPTTNPDLGVLISVCWSISVDHIWRSEMVPNADDNEIDVDGQAPDSKLLGKVEYLGLWPFFRLPIVSVLTLSPLSFLSCSLAKILSCFVSSSFFSSHVVLSCLALSCLSSWSWSLFSVSPSLSVSWCLGLSILVWCLLSICAIVGPLWCREDNWVVCIVMW